MNMMSTGAFHTEMDASEKQQSLAERFAAVWEKKNAKAARAGGVSLMALSLAACGSSSETTTTDTSTDTTTTPVADAAKAFVATDGLDVFTGGSGDDSMRSDNSTAAAGDSFTGGAGTDTLKLYGTDTLPELDGVENIYISGNLATKSFAGQSDVVSIEYDADATAGATTDTITLAAGQTLTLDSITDGSGAASDTSGASGGMSIASAATVTEVSLVVDGVGAKTAGNDVDIAIAGTGVTTLNIEGSTNASYIGVTNSGGGALATINVTGDALVDMVDGTPALPTTIRTIDASDNSGGIKVDLSGNTANVTVTGGSGNDTIDMGAGLNVLDTVAGGAGTDTLIVDEATLTAATNATVLGIQNTSGFERILSTGTSGVAIRLNRFDDATEAGNTAATTGAAGASGDSGAAGSDGTDGVAITHTVAGNAVVITANATGGDGGTSEPTASGAHGDGGDGGNGGDAVSVTPVTNNGTNSIDIIFDATAAITLTGGSGGDGGLASVGASSGGDGGDGGDGGYALDVSTMETVNISTTHKDADVTLTGGAAGAGGGSGALAGDDNGAAGTAGTGIYAGANATFVLTGAGDLNLGTITASAGTTADDFTVDGSGLTGVLTVTTGAGADTITGGSKADTLNGGAGNDTIDGGAGNDEITGGTGTDTLTGGAGADDFNFDSTDADTAKASFTAAGDVITDFSSAVDDEIDFGTAGAGSSTTYAEAQSAAATFAAFMTAADSALDGTVLYYAGQLGDNLLLAYDGDGTGITSVTQLTGVTLADFAAADIIA